MRSRAQRWLRIVPGLADHQLKVQYAWGELYQQPPGEVASGLDDLCARVDGTDVPARDVLGAFVPLLTDVAHLPKVVQVRRAALEAQLPAAGRLLRCSTPAGHLLLERGDPDELSTGVVQRSDGTPLTLGERRALARRPSRASLRRLMRDPHPMVARVVLGNPRITEEDVVFMAARRPAVSHVVCEIARQWSRHARVRLAIVLNPGSPPGVSVPLLGLMLRPELSEVASAPDVPAVVRATAGELVDLRPPLAWREPPAAKH